MRTIPPAWGRLRRVGDNNIAWLERLLGLVLPPPALLLALALQGLLMRLSTAYKDYGNKKFGSNPDRSTAGGLIIINSSLMNSFIGDRERASVGSRCNPNRSAAG